VELDQIRYSENAAHYCNIASGATFFPKRKHGLVGGCQNFTRLIHYALVTLCTASALRSVRPEARKPSSWERSVLMLWQRASGSLPNILTVTLLVIEAKIHSAKSVSLSGIGDVKVTLFPQCSPVFSSLCLKIAYQYLPPYQCAARLQFVKEI